jgi:hypothetical protein
MVYGDPAAGAATHRLTAPPTGALANSGWQYVGTFGSGSSRYVGTPISPSHFITANHVGATSSITYQGVTYPVTGSAQIGGSDLRVYSISGTFPSYAPLYDEQVDGALTGKQLVTYGRGVAPGTAVTSTPVGAKNPVTRNGWTWGNIDGAVSWGTNTVDSLTSDGLISFSASSSGGATEGAVTDKDSGGPVFVQGAGGTWKLAGINYGVSAYSFYTITPSKSATNNLAYYDPQGPQQADYYYVNVTAKGAAAVWDTTNLFVLDHTNSGFNFYMPAWLYTDNGLQTYYASSISSNLEAIRAVAMVPEPAAAMTAGAFALLLCQRRRRV